MKIALIGPVFPYRGGIAHYTTMTARALDEAGHDVLLISFSRQYPAWLFPGDSDKDPSQSPLRVAAPNYWLDSLNPLSWLTTFWRLRRARPDGIVLQWWTTFWAPVWITLGLLNRLFLRRPLLCICHNVLPHEAHGWDRWAARLTLRWGTGFIVQSAAEEERLRQLVGPARIRVIPHPVYDFLDGESRTRAAARRQLNLPDHVPVILFFGIVREYKGLRDLLAALPSVLARIGKARLLIAGEFWEPKEPYLALIRKLDIQSAVTIDDRYVPNEEVADYFAAANLMAAPYRRMTDSGALQMARGFGLPVVRAQPTLEDDDRIRKLADDLIAALIQLQSGERVTATTVEPRATWRDLADAIGALTAANEPNDGAE